MGPEAVHNNHKNMRILHRDGQRAYERTHSRAEFMSLIVGTIWTKKNRKNRKRTQKTGSCSWNRTVLVVFGASENQCERCERKRDMIKRLRHWLIEARKKKCHHCCLLVRMVAHMRKEDK